MKYVEIKTDKTYEGIYILKTIKPYWKKLNKFEINGDVFCSWTEVQILLTSQFFPD